MIIRMRAYTHRGWAHWLCSLMVNDFGSHVHYVIVSCFRSHSGHWWLLATWTQRKRDRCFNQYHYQVRLPLIWWIHWCMCGYIYIHKRYPHPQALSVWTECLSNIFFFFCVPMAMLSVYVFKLFVSRWSQEWIMDKVMAELGILAQTCLPPDFSGRFSRFYGSFSGLPL